MLKEKLNFFYQNLIKIYKFSQNQFSETSETYVIKTKNWYQIHAFHFSVSTFLILIVTETIITNFLDI